MEIKSRQPVGTPEERHWNPTLYDGKHSWVWKYGAELMEMLSPQPGERLLDLGCGTGHLTQQIAATGADVIGLDRSASMIRQARKSYPDLKFVIADATCFAFARPFDAVFSNAALHWIRDADAVAACVAMALRQGGRFVAEFGGKGNLQTLLAALRRALEKVDGSRTGDWHHWYFPSIGEYAGVLERHGLAVASAVLFDRPTELEDDERGLQQWLEMFTPQLLAGLSPTRQEELIRTFAEQLRPALFCDGRWVADYRRLRVVAIRE